MNLSVKRNRKIYFLFLFLTSTFFIIINVETGILLLAVSEGLSPLRQNTLFPLTYSLAIFSFFISLYWFRNDGILSIPLSIGVPFLWVTFFEVLWQNSFLLTGKFNGNLTAYRGDLFASYVACAISSDLNSPSIRGYIVPHTKPCNFTDAATHEAISGPTSLTTFCQETR